MNASKLAHWLVPRSVRAYIYRFLTRHTLLVQNTPMSLAALSVATTWSAGSKQWDTHLDRGIGGWIEAPNHSGGYHGLLHQWWTFYGLGQSCLLVSESSEVRICFQKYYPETKMVATDYYLDISPTQAHTDVVWNLYEMIPKTFLEMQFSSVICQATLEHLLDPVGVFRKFAAVLMNGGHLYLHTHTPLFPYHGWPKDYLRFFPEWFRDLPLVVPEMEIIEVYFALGHAFAVYRKRAPRQDSAPPTNRKNTNVYQTI